MSSFLDSCCTPAPTSKWHFPAAAVNKVQSYGARLLWKLDKQGSLLTYQTRGVRMYLFSKMMFLVACVDDDYSKFMIFSEWLRGDEAMIELRFRVFAREDGVIG